MTDRVAAAKRSRKRDELMAAYEAYQRREPASMDKLLAAVRKFAYMKLYHLEHDFKDFGSARRQSTIGHRMCRFGCGRN